MLLEVRIKKKFTDFTLQTEFTVKNEIFTILGASGCGKSMTLKCIAGIEQPDSGKIVLGGRVLFDSQAGINLTPQQRKVGYMFQDYALFQNMVVRKNIAAGMKGRHIEERVDKYIEDFHLTGLDNRYPGELSGGQKQRVAMARMMAAEPEVILLDEPFSALDSFLKNKMLQEMKQELKNRRLPVLFVTHDRDEAFALGHKICAMHDGKNEAVEEKKEFFQRPKTVNAAILSGCKNITAVERIDERHYLAAGWNLTFEVESAMQEIVAVGIRAHDIMTAQEAERIGKNKDMITMRRQEHRVEEALFEWDIYLRFEGASEEFLWKLEKENTKSQQLLQIPEDFFVLKEHVLFLV